MSWSNLFKIGKLTQIWGVATIVSAVVCMLLYSQFFGQRRVIINETIYENYRYVALPGTTQLYTEEGSGLTSYGENGLVVDKVLDPDLFRVLFIGDSFVAARHISDHGKFTEIVEHMWNREHPERTIQTVNLGLGDQDMATYLSFGRNMDRHFEPDLVFLVVSRNDFKSIANDPVKLQKVTNDLREPITEPQTFSYLEDLINQSRYRSFLGKLQAQTYGFLHTQRGIVKAETNWETPPPLGREPIQAQLRALEQIWGERLVIVYKVTIPNLGHGAPATYDDEVLREAEVLEIPVINLYEPFLEAFHQKKPPTGFNNSILGEGHFNHHGHQIVAEEVIKFMEARRDLF